VRAQAALIVVPNEGERSVETDALRALRRSLVEQSSLPLLDREPALSRALGDPQRPSIAVTEVEALQRESVALLDAVAFGRDEEAIARGERVLERERGRLASVGRSDAAARALSEICLFVARALQHRGELARASAQIRRCWHMVPDLTAPASVHPPEVRALVSHAKGDAALARVRITAPGSAVEGCTLRVQGRALGALPAALELVPGTYAFQIDCAVPGLVHTRTLEAGAELLLQLAVDLEQRLSFDREELALAVDPEHRGTRALLAQLGERLDVAELWALEVRAHSAWLARFAVRPSQVELLGERTIALAPLPLLAARMDRAVAELACAPHCARVARDGDAADGAPRVLAYVGAGTGIVALTASWLLFGRYVAFDDNLDTLVYDTPSYARDLEARDAAGTAALVTSAAGSALLAGTAPWWLPRARGVPWLAWLAGATGMFGAGIGVALWTEHGELRDAACRPFELCSRRRSRVPLAPMLVTQGVALLAIPIVYALREPEQEPAAVSLRVSRSRLELVCSGRFGAF
jgi:hypothetical protein